MARKRRGLSPFSLSFLDIMSCGFGAVVLLFLIIKHNADATIAEPAPDLSAEVDLLQEEVREGEQGLVEIRNTISDVDDRLAEARGLARRIEETIEEIRGRTEGLATEGQEDEIDALKERLRRLEARKRQLEEEIRGSGQAARTFVGEGQRQYLTGLKIGGRRILVLLDSSASMLDETIVNVIRRRNMSEEVQRNAPKWRQALATVDWVSARFPPGSEYQIYTFDTDVQPALSGTEGRWLPVSDTERLDEAIEQLRAVVPAGGTGLERAFAAIGALQPRPDNIYLITDGLPTQGLQGTRSGTVSGRERLKLFESALRRLPRNIPVNVILAPMEGDPMAASAFWQLAQLTNGAFLSPSRDWP